MLLLVERYDATTAANAGAGNGAGYDNRAVGTFIAGCDVQGVQSVILRVSLAVRRGKLLFRASHDVDCLVCNIDDGRSDNPNLSRTECMAVLERKVCRVSCNG